VKELKAQSKEEGQHKLDAYLASAAQRKVSGFMVEINGERAVVAGRFGGLGHVASPCG
jgi:hypothetical protein